jgi:hypothetical protein
MHISLERHVHIIYELTSDFTCLLSLQELCLTYRGSDCVIYDSSFSVHSWVENWVGQLSSQVHSKTGIVIYFHVSQDNE